MERREREQGLRLVPHYPTTPTTTVQRRQTEPQPLSCSSGSGGGREARTCHVSGPLACALEQELVVRVQRAVKRVGKGLGQRRRALDVCARGPACEARQERGEGGRGL
jgi:hypothetical protein